MALKWTAYGPRRVISVQHCTATAALEGDVERNGLSTLGRQFLPRAGVKKARRSTSVSRKLETSPSH